MVSHYPTEVHHESKPAERLGAIEIIKLTDTETRAVLVHLAGHRDAVVASAVVDAVRQVLDRTRPLKRRT